MWLLVCVLWLPHLEHGLKWYYFFTINTTYVQYNPVAKNFDKDVNGRIVLRRISCDIIDVSFKYWKLPTLPIPLRKKGGFLDFIYLDEDIRVTRGNRGGLFVHFRPDYLDSLL